MNTFCKQKLLYVLVCLSQLFAGCSPTRPITQTINNPSNNNQYLTNWFWTSDAFPLLVRVDLDLDLEVQEKIYLAIEDWNNAIGEQIFSYYPFNVEYVIVAGIVQDLQYATIIVFSKELGRLPNGNVILGMATRNVISVHEADNFGRMSSCIVNIDEDIDALNVRLVAVHELGHALGLSHSIDRNSVMYEHVLDSGGRITEEEILPIRHMLHTPARNPF